MLTSDRYLYGVNSHCIRYGKMTDTIYQNNREMRNELTEIEGVVATLETPGGDVAVHYRPEPWTIAYIQGVYHDHDHTVTTHEESRKAGAEHYMVGTHDPEGERDSWRDDK